MADEGAVEIPQLPAREAAQPPPLVKATEQAAVGVDVGESEVKNGGGENKGTTGQTTETNDDVKAATKEVVDEGLKSGGDPRGALEALAHMTESAKFEAVQANLSALYQEGKLPREKYQRTGELLQKAAAQQEVKSLAEQADTLIALEDNPFSQALGYDLKISRLEQLSASGQVTEEQKAKIQTEIDKLLAERAKKGLKGDRGQAANEFYAFLTGEPKGDRKATFTDIEGAMVDLVSNPERARNFVTGMEKVLSEDEIKAFRPVLDEITNFDPEQEAGVLVRKAKGEQRRKRVETVGMLFALVAIFMLRQAQKSVEGGQR